MSDDEKELLTYDEAVALLPDGERIHTFLDANGVLLGADWGRAKVLALLKASDTREVTGPSAQAIGHGLAAFRADGVPVFIETRQP